MITKKRSYSPTIDDIRQFNIKKSKIFKDLENLNLTNSSTTSSTEQQDHIAISQSSDRNHEIIPDLDEYLLQNQSDEDIIESSKDIHFDDADGPGNNLIIPNSILELLPKQTSIDRILSRRKFRNEYFGDEFNDEVSNGEIYKDSFNLKNYSIIKYHNPWEVLYRHWENWYFNIFQLQQCSTDLNIGMINDNDEMIDDDIMIDETIYDARDDESITKDNVNGIKQDDEQMYKVPNTYGGYYHITTSSDDPDMMELD